MYNEINELLENESKNASEILEIDQNESSLKRFKKRIGTKLILFTSHTPCKYSNSIWRKTLRSNIKRTYYLQSKVETLQ